MASEPKWWEKREEPKTIWQACKTSDGLDYYYNSVTGETAWEKPEELMTDEEKDKQGNWQWVPDPQHGYVAAKLLGKAQTKKQARILKKTKNMVEVELLDGTKKNVDSDKLFECKKSSLQRLVSDLVLLDDMVPPLILHNLRVRYEKNQIYTNVGTILISINPYQWLDIYNKAVTEDYIGRGVKEMPPHVFNIAHDAFWGLKEFKKDQSIIISGESGAGKTEAMKQCLNYLAAIAGSHGGVEKKILQANPILEAWGNAKTIRNDNSSRFGKFCQVFFDEKTMIKASKTENYLLEKIRVNLQGDNERNFHIFYQMAKCKDSKMRKQYSLETPESYTYLKKCVSVEGIDDVKDFAEVLEAMKDLGFSQQDQESLLGTTSAVMAVGNTEFKSKGSQTEVADKKWVQVASSLIQVNEAKLTRALTIRELRIKGQSTTDVVLNPKEAGDVRDALARFVYGEMFNWLVQRINKSMTGPTGKTMPYIGILDIFGFEIFKYNSFEQLCINFTNEQLQQHFNQHTFKLEEQVYVAEKIKFKHIEFIDNQPMIELITKKPSGVLPMLDEELVVPRGTDSTYVDKLHKKQKENKVYKSVLKDPMSFVISHYAGDVTYTVEGFLEKNRDRLTDDLLELLVGSKSSFINELFPKSVLDMETGKKSSLSSKFLSQLRELMIALNRTEPHYIRCIKPNHTKSPNVFQAQMSYEQLTYSGVFEAVAIRKQGFPFRLTHKEFAERYACLNTMGGTSDKAKCMAIKKEMKIDDENFQMGTTMALYRAEEHKKLELNRNIKLMTLEIAEKLRELCNKNVNSMNEGQKEDHFTALARAVRQADEFRMKTPEAERARDLLENFVEQRMDADTKKKLQEAVASKEQKLLEEVLATCSAKGYRTKLVRAANELLEKVKDAEGALAYALNAKQIEFLDKALAMCDEFKYTSPTEKEARQLLSDIHECERMCQSSMQSKDHEELQAAVDLATRIGWQHDLVEDTRHLLRQVLEVRQQLEHSMFSLQQADLNVALQQAQGLGYASALTEEAEALLYRVSKILQELDQASQTMEEEQIRVAVWAADELGMDNQVLQYFRTLINGTPDAFLEAQYNRAKERKEIDRAIRLAIKRKDLLIQSTGDQYIWTKYRMFKTAMDWSNSRMLGLGKHHQKSAEERAKHFQTWQKNKIHSVLMEYSSPDKNTIANWKKQLKKGFEAIQKWMGQRDDKDPAGKLYQTLMDGRSTATIRNELYCYVLKQMTNNPEPASNSKGWEALAMMLNSFPPSNDFENCLEHYFRKNQQQAEQWKCIGLLRRICENEQGVGMPGAGDVLNVGGFVSPRMRGFTTVVHRNPSWQELFRGYYGEGDYVAGNSRGPSQPRGPVGAGGGGGKQQNPKWSKELDDDSGDYYYVNNESGQTQWEQPPDFYLQAKPKAAGGPVRPNLRGGAGAKAGGGGAAAKAEPAKAGGGAATKFGGAGAGPVAGLAGALAARGGPAGSSGNAATSASKIGAGGAAGAAKENKFAGKFGGGDAGGVGGAAAKFGGAAGGLKAAGEAGAKSKSPARPAAAAAAAKPAAAAAAAKKQPTWEMEFDPETGDPFYVNLATGHTQWEKPADFDGADASGGGAVNGTSASQPSAAAKKQPKWEMEIDPDSGDPFYVRLQDGHTQWDRPADFDGMDVSKNKQPAQAAQPVQPAQPVHVQAKAAAVAKAAPKWEAELDDQSGDVFYVRVADGHTQWERPGDFDGKEVQPRNAAGGAAAGGGGGGGKGGPWIALVDDESGDTYYCNEQTGETTWDKPPGFK
eukprot:g79262.t1